MKNQRKIDTQALHEVEAAGPNGHTHPRLRNLQDLHGKGKTEHADLLFHKLIEAHEGKPGWEWLSEIEHGKAKSKAQRIDPASLQTEVK